MLVAWKRLDDCDLSRPFGPWLRGIAHRLVLAHYRKQKRNPLPLSDEVLEIVDEHFENIHAHPGDTWDEKDWGIAQVPRVIAGKTPDCGAGTIPRG